jgi:hypothetical protein
VSYTSSEVRQKTMVVERVMGFEPTTLCLGSNAICALWHRYGNPERNRQSYRLKDRPIL